MFDCKNEEEKSDFRFSTKFGSLNLLLSLTEIMLHELGFDVAKEPAEKDCDKLFFTRTELGG